MKYLQDYNIYFAEEDQLLAIIFPCVCLLLSVSSPASNDSLSQEAHVFTVPPVMIP